MLRRIVLTLCSLAALSITTAVASADELALGATAPMADTKLKNVNGKEVSIASVKGSKGTLVIFTCNHCPWAKAWEGRIAELSNTYSKKGIGVVLINANDPAAYPEDDFDGNVAKAKQLKLNVPYAVDATSDVARAFGATKTPEVYLFDKPGKLVYHGAVDDNAKEADKVTARYLKDALDAVVAGKPVPLAETKALGCTIKYRDAKSS